MSARKVANVAGMILLFLLAPLAKDFVRGFIGEMMRDASEGATPTAPVVKAAEQEETPAHAKKLMQDYSPALLAVCLCDAKCNAELNEDRR